MLCVCVYYIVDGENDYISPAPRKRFWRWSQRFVDNPHLEQETKLQDVIDDMLNTNNDAEVILVLNLQGVSE